MKTTTAKNLTDAQIRTLRSEAGEHSDLETVMVCDLALMPRADAQLDPDEYTGYSRDEWRRGASLTRDEARARVAEVISDAEAAASGTVVRAVNDAQMRRDDDTIEAIVSERGNGFPNVEDYVPGEAPIAQPEVTPSARRRAAKE